MNQCPTKDKGKEPTVKYGECKNTTGHNSEQVGDTGRSTKLWKYLI